jgi:hypothetical protein
VLRYEVMEKRERRENRGDMREEEREHTRRE